MSTELANIPANLPAFLTGEANNDAFGAGISAGGGLPRVSIRGRAFHIVEGDEETTLTTPDGEYNLKSIKVAVIAARPTLSKRYYDKPYDPNVELEAACFSIDAITPNPGVPAAPAKACASCPMNVWGSGRGNSKLCSDYKRVVVVPVAETGELVPWGGEVRGFVLDIPAASLKNFRSYTAQLTSHKVPVQAAITSIKFEEAEFPLLGFNFSGVITEASYHQINELVLTPEIQDAISTMPIDVSRQSAAQLPAGEPESVPTPPPYIADEPTPEPEPAAAEPAGDDGDELDDMDLADLRTLGAQLGIPEAEKRRSKTLRDLIREAREKGVTPSEPAPEPKPEPAAEPANTTVGDPALEDKVSKVLEGWN
jgi:hypothetical protein